MPAVTLEFLTQQLELADQLLAGRSKMLEPQDLPGRYGRVVHAIDRLLQVTQTEAVLGGGWAVWRHGFVGRVTQDLDIALAADRIDEFLRVAAVAGFEVLPLQPGRWPKLRHKDTGVQVDILPEGARPGTTQKLAPTTIPHPSLLGAQGPILRYLTLPRLIELKIAAGRPRDEADIAELMRARPEEATTIRQHLETIHPDYVASFDHLVQRAREQGDD